MGLLIGPGVPDTPAHLIWELSYRSSYFAKSLVVGEIAFREKAGRSQVDSSFPWSRYFFRSE
jgi:hypothetical protein